MLSPLTAEPSSADCWLSGCWHLQGCLEPRAPALASGHTLGSALQFLEVSYAVAALVTYSEWLVLNCLSFGSVDILPHHQENVSLYSSI